MIRVFIDGKEGTTGLKIYDRLRERDDVELLLLNEEKRKDPSARGAMMQAADAVFLCLPDDAAREAVRLIAEVGSNAAVIDASTAHRTESDWSYGFPELSEAFRLGVETGTRIAVPGCHASGFAALVYPLVACGMLPRDYPLACFSLTGYSGGGKKMIAEYENTSRGSEYSAPRQYALGQQHKHLREMRHVGGLAFEPLFSPVVADFYCGMQVSVPLHTALLAGRPGVREVHKVLSEHYGTMPGLVSVLPFGEEPAFISANSLSQRDSMLLTVSGNDERVLLTATFDNLGKGASGAAVQCMNIHFGIQESKGLVL